MYTYKYNVKLEWRCGLPLFKAWNLPITKTSRFVPLPFVCIGSTVVHMTIIITRITDVFQSFYKRQHHKETVRTNTHLRFGRWIFFIVGQIGDSEPRATLNFTSSFWTEFCWHRDVSNDIQPEITFQSTLLQHLNFFPNIPAKLVINGRLEVFLGVEKLADIETGLFQDFAYSTIGWAFFLVYFSFGKTPRRFRPVALD